MPATAYYPLQDTLYRTTALTDDAGDIVEVYDYDAYGNTLVCTAPGTAGNWWADDATQSAIPTFNKLYCGYYYDPDIAIYFVNRRYYNQILGRFLSRDYITIPQDFMHVYTYVDNAPSRFIDPDGRAVVLPEHNPNPTPETTIEGVLTNTQIRQPTTLENIITIPPLPSPFPPPIDRCASGCNEQIPVNRCPRKYVINRPRYKLPPANGCGSEGGKGFPAGGYYYTFEIACNHHDDCYGTCRTGVSSLYGHKNNCDSKFRQEMHDSCHTFWNSLGSYAKGNPVAWLIYDSCHAQAEAYYKAVSASDEGKLAYFDSQEKACCCSCEYRESWQLP